VGSDLLYTIEISIYIILCAFYIIPMIKEGNTFGEGEA